MSYFSPVHLKVGKIDIIKLSQQRHLMRILIHFLQIVTVLLEGPCLVPPLRNPRIVLPDMEQMHVVLVVVVEMHHGEQFFQVGNVSTVHDCAAAWLRWADRVLGVNWVSVQIECHGVLVGKMGDGGEVQW